LFTPVAGKSSGPTVDPMRRVSGERCAFLMACAMHHRLHEVWISLQPILLFTYLAQYMPAFASRLGNVFGPRRVAAFRAGVVGYSFSKPKSA
jgi:hypothetical protein